MLPLALVLLVCGAGAGAGQRQAAASFSAAEQACLAQKKVLYGVDGNCYDLVKRGPCGAGQWLVFDLQEAVNGTGALRPVCKPCPCCDQPLKLYWPPTGGCRKKTEKLCTHPGTAPVSDPFGEGECACVADPPHLRYDRDINNTSIEERCYQLYTRGPCGRKEVLVAALLPGYGRVARCASDPCYRENEATPLATPGHAPYSLRGTTRCHALYTTGPCTGDQVFRVHADTLRPECFSHTTSLFDLTERNCKEEHMTARGCPQQLNAVSQEQHMAYMWEMSIKAVKRRKKKRT